MESRRSERLIVGAVMLLAVTLRFWPLAFPVDVNPDEENVVTRALRIGRDGLNPQWYKYPPLFLYILFVTYGARYTAEKAVGLVPSAQAFAEHYFAHPLPFFVQGRLISAILGTCAVWALYLLAQQLSFSRRAAAAAALVFAVSPLLVNLSHFALTDGPTLLPFILSLLFAVRLFKQGRSGNAFLAGLLAGLGAAVKYPAGVAVVGCLTAVIGYSRGGNSSRTWNLLYKAVFGTMVGFLLACPWAILDFHRFWQYLLLLYEFIPHTDGNMPGSTGYVPYLFNYLPQALGWPLYLAGLSGLALWFRRDGWPAAIVTGPALVLWLVMGMAKTHAPRYALLMLPALALGTVWWLDCLGRKSTSRARVLAIVVVLCLAPPLATSIVWSIRMALPDTQTLATYWIERHVPQGSSVLSESYGPRLAYTPDQAWQIATSERALDPRAGSKFAYLAAHPPIGRPGYHFTVIPIYERREGISDFDTGWYNPERVNAERIDWVILSSAIYQRYAGQEGAFPRQAAFGRWLTQCWQEIVRFGPHEPLPTSKLTQLLGRPGPTLRIFKRQVPPPPGCQNLTL